jgi:hypothetical protein
MSVHDVIRGVMVLGLVGISYWARFLIEDCYHAMKEEDEE